MAIKNLKLANSEVSETPLVDGSSSVARRAKLPAMAWRPRSLCIQSITPKLLQQSSNVMLWTVNGVHVSFRPPSTSIGACAQSHISIKCGAVMRSWDICTYIVIMTVRILYVGWMHGKSHKHTYEQ
jgi:hypothetical protein